MYLLFLIQIKEIKREIENKFSNNNNKTKFVILVYEEDYSENWSELEKEDIIVLKVSDLVDINVKDKKYKLGDNVHPTKEVWEIIVPALKNRLAL